MIVMMVMRVCLCLFSCQVLVLVLCPCVSFCLFVISVMSVSVSYLHLLVLWSLLLLFLGDLLFTCHFLSGEIGGQIGLCVGASLLTVIEFLDVIFSILKIRLGY